MLSLYYNLFIGNEKSFSQSPQRAQRIIEKISEALQIFALFALFARNQSVFAIKFNTYFR
ncbi:MAG: hypothetical protein BWK80_07565 [Desulfobacteraceae bacterium IS3]|nr:MAG: hypothetical protein BWK80_07565 [Desulfobacteraceae bacterium IS3]